MKKLSYILILVFLSVYSTAQDYKITFSLTGEANEIDSVIVENATKNTSIKLNGNDTLVLTNLATTIHQLEKNISLNLKAYPNPAETFFTLNFQTNQPERIRLRVYELSGREMMNKQFMVHAGIHSSEIRNLPKGIFVVQIHSENISEQVKIVSMNKNNTLPEISAIQSIPHTETKLSTKSATSAQLLGYEVYDNITIRVWPSDPFITRGSITQGFVMDEENPIMEENPLSENTETNNVSNLFVFEYTPCTDNCGNQYNTVEIGDQIWMAENFRCPTENSWLYNDDANNEELYGRLYTWEDALNNAPEGWHLPTNEEWLELEEHINTLYGEKVPLALKSKTGWLPDEFQNSTNGNDASGFNIYPGGARWFLNGTFYNQGSAAYFWSSTKSDSIRARIRKFTISDTQIASGASNVDYGFSVRYVKDKEIYGTFTDERDGTTYKTIKIGDQTWMAENFALKTDTGSWAYNNDENTVGTYGRLYNWETAEASAPEGWRLPDDDEWKTLEIAIGLESSLADDYGERGEIGKKMKSISNWEDGGNGDNTTGFSVQPAGARWFEDGSFYNQGVAAYFWTRGLDPVPNATSRKLTNSSDAVFRQTSNRGYAFSVRYLKDENVPKIATQLPKLISNTYFTMQGSIIDNGGSPVTEAGFYWSTTVTHPQSTDSVRTEGATSGDFGKKLQNLEPNTTYYFRAFAGNKNGVVIGDVIEIKTNFSYDSTEYDCMFDLRDFRTYKTKTIGTQTWMAENLRAKYFNDLIEIPIITDADLWSETQTAALCYYDNDIQNLTTYGYLYNYKAVETKKLCPKGWHVSLREDWLILKNALQSSMVAKLLKEVGTEHWITNPSSTNSSGFSGLPGGSRDNAGNYSGLGEGGVWWAPGQYSGVLYREMLTHLNTDLNEYYPANPNYGLSVRCVKD